MSKACSELLWLSGTWISFRGATSSELVVPDGKAKMAAHFLGYEESGKHCND